MVGIRVIKTQSDKTLTPIEGSEHLLSADAVILAFGFKPAHYPWLDENNIEYASSGRIIILDNKEIPIKQQTLKCLLEVILYEALILW